MLAKCYEYFLGAALALLAVNLFGLHYAHATSRTQQIRVTAGNRDKFVRLNERSAVFCHISNRTYPGLLKRISTRSGLRLVWTRIAIRNFGSRARKYEQACRNKVTEIQHPPTPSPDPNGNSSSSSSRSSLTPSSLAYSSAACSFSRLSASRSSARSFPSSSTSATSSLPGNRAPVANWQMVLAQTATPKTITLSGRDPEDQALSFILITQPAHGALAGDAPDVSYLSDPGYQGSDSFTFQVNDGAQDSNIATVSITVSPASRGPQTIGSQALIPLPNAALWGGLINFQPGNGEAVEINPPIFSWFYNLDDPNMLTDTSLKQFELQISYDSTFAHPIVDVRTESNMYNFLAPFSRSPVYWRVGYIAPAAGPNVYKWSDTRVFSVKPGAPVWDRSILADESYLSDKLSVHPHLLFNASSRADYSSYMQVVKNSEWRQIKNAADYALNLSWWNGAFNDPVANPNEADFGSVYIASVAFMRQLSNDPKYLAARPQDVLYRAAQAFVASKRVVSSDLVSAGGAGIEYLALAYDWLYEDMTQEQRNYVASVIGLHCKYAILGRLFYFPRNPTGDDPVNGAYPGERKIANWSLFVYAESHMAASTLQGLMAAMAAANEDPWAARLLKLLIQLTIARPVYNGNEQSMNNGGYMFSNISNAFTRQMWLHFTFPEADFTLHPFVHQVADWYSRIKPVGTEAESFTWGDTNNAFGPDYWTAIGKSLAYVGNSGAALEHWREQSAIYWGNQIPPTDNGYGQSALEFFFDPPQEEDTSPSSKVFPVGGWAFGSTYPSNHPEAFRDGLGFVFPCRPAATTMSHAAAVDLSFELSAYGQTITENGAPSWAFNKFPEAHNTLTVNGYGPLWGAGNQTTPYRGRIFAFAQTPQFTYAAGEGKGFYLRMVNSILSKVNRHILMVKNKYFVIFDDLETTTPATFSWVFHILEDAVSWTDQTSGVFQYLKTMSSPALGNNLPSNYYYPAVPITTQVSHIGRGAGGLEVLDLTGANRLLNPKIGIVNSANGDLRTHAIWVSNKTPQSKWHFMSVIYPQKPGAQEALIERLDDYTARVTNDDGTVDVVSFNPATANSYGATLVVDIPNLQPLPVQ